MKLPDGAFDTERIEVLKNMTSVDIQACPGSGKTTLLVAKLAILCKQWPFKTKGICVLSHTNVAREEIEKRLGNTDVGKALLSYPHYIGTIHGFVNEFISLPWIRSKEWPVNIIDSSIVQLARFQALPPWIKDDNRAKYLPLDFMEPIDLPTTLKACSWGRLKTDSPSCSRLVSIVKSTINKSQKNGFFTFNEMFLFANEALDNLDFLVDDLRTRFPYVFLDEAQDSNEMQNQLLNKVFTRNADAHIRQRFGDGNQAIFNSTNGSAATTDLFPDTTNEIKINKSHRLHASIAKLSDPFGLSPHNMAGMGGRPDSTPKHTIFLYDNETINNVLPSYAKLVLNEFSDDDFKKNHCHAVGMVHNSDRSAPLGSDVKHYHTSYNPTLSKSQPSLNNLTEFIQAGILKFHSTNELSSGMNLIAKGIIRYLNSMPGETFPQTKSPYRLLRSVLSEINDNHVALDQWLSDVLLNEFNEEKWNNISFPSFTDLLNKSFSLSPLPAEDFLKWSPLSSSSPLVSVSSPTSQANIYTYQAYGRSIDIKLGSIHSVKGQTHLSTLVLDTFWNGRKGKTNLTYLLDWLTGNKSGKSSEGAYNQSRLKCHYVAMTRATDLLCLAMPKTAITGKTKDDLISIGWAVKELT